MDFFEDLFDFGDRKHRGEKRGSNHNHKYDDDDHDQRYNDHPPSNQGYDKQRRVAGTLKCIKCSSSLTDSINFCPHCGTPVSQQIKCNFCGVEIIPQAKFCASCGAKAQQQ